MKNVYELIYLHLFIDLKIKYISGWSNGTESVKKDSLEKHLAGEPHKHAANIEAKKCIGAEAFTRTVVGSSAIGQGFARMVESDKEVQMYNILLGKIHPVTILSGKILVSFSLLSF